MKILLVANGISRAGTSRVLSLLSQAWSQQHEVSISLFRPYSHAYSLGGKVIQNGIPLKGCVLSQVYHLYRLLKQTHYDKVFGFSEDANYPLAIAAKWAGVSHRVVLTVHNPVQKFSAKVKKRVQKHYSSVHCVLGVSQGVAKGLVELGVPAEKVVFRPNPIDLEMVWRAVNQPPERILEPNSVLHFISVGRLHSHKGFDVLIEAFYQVYKAVPKVKLWIVGEGGQKEALHRQIEALGLESSVMLTGSVQNPYALLNQADIFVLSSRLEGWPLVLMEAMAVGLPCIAFTCPNGPDEIIQNDSMGLLVPCMEVDKLAQEMIRLAKDSDLRTKLGKKGQERMKKFEVDKISLEWLSV